MPPSFGETVTVTDPPKAGSVDAWSGPTCTPTAAPGVRLFGSNHRLGWTPTEETEQEEDPGGSQDDATTEQ
jgi:hypothetical protein